MSVLEYTQGYSKLLEAKTLAELMTTNPHPTNCPNCGAPLPSSGKCEYCGTEYDAAPKRYVNPTIAKYLRDLYLGGKVEDPPQLEFTTKYQRTLTEKFLLATYPPFPEAE